MANDLTLLGIAKVLDVCAIAVYDKSFFVYSAIHVGRTFVQFGVPGFECPYLIVKTFDDLFSAGS
jgi:hypothetical protein